MGEKVCSIEILDDSTDDDDPLPWRVEIDPPRGSAHVLEAYFPTQGTALDAAIKWAKDRGLVVALLPPLEVVRPSKVHAAGR